MENDVRAWYHLLYITDQIKSADQKAYIVMAVVCAVTGFSNQGFTRIIAHLMHGITPSCLTIIIFVLFGLFLAGFVGALGEFYRIIFPKINNEKYLKNRTKSAIFWHDVATMTFDGFREQYRGKDSDEDLLVQIYVLSQIARVKFGRIKRLFACTIFVIACDVLLFFISKGL